MSTAEVRLTIVEKPFGFQMNPVDYNVFEFTVTPKGHRTFPLTAPVRPHSQKKTKSVKRSNSWSFFSS